MVKGEKGLQSLKVWQKSLDFAVLIHKDVLPLLPDEEIWALGNQLRRAAQSVPANIAEGYIRYYYQEGIRFCYIARGSLEEVASHLALSNKLGYIPDAINQDYSKQIQEIRRMLNSYIAFLKQSKRGENEPGSQHHAIQEPAPSYEIEQEMNIPDTQSPDF